MLKTTKCSNCENKIKKAHNFCPTCGIQLKETSEDYGMLGTNDKVKQTQKAPQVKIFGGGITGGIMNKVVNRMISDLSKAQGQTSGVGEKELAEAMRQLMPGAKISIKKTPLNNQNQPGVQIKKEAPKNLPIDFSEDNLKKWPTLKKEEPQTNLKRIGDRIQYEIEVPGVETIKDISIVKLEKSLEVKAIAKENAYVKVIPIDMPLKKFTLLKGKLTLELDASM